MIYPTYATNAQICSIVTLNFLGPRSLTALCSLTSRVHVASDSQTVNNMTVPIQLFDEIRHGIKLKS